MSARKEYEFMFALRANMDSSFQGTFQKSGGLMKELQGKANELKKVMRDVDAYKKTEEAIKNNTDKMARQKQAYEDAREKLDRHNATLKEYNKELVEAQSRQEQERVKLQKLQEQFEKTTAPTKKLTTELERQKKAYENAGKAIETAEKRVKNAEKAESNAAVTLRNKERVLGDTTHALDLNVIGLENLKKTLREAGIDTDNLTESNKKVAESYEEIRAAQEAVGLTDRKLQENKAALSSAKASFMSNLYLARAAASTAYSAAIAPSADFNAQMSRVEAKSGANKAEIAQLKTVARESGLKTTYTATESGQALEYMALAGWTPEKMAVGLSGIVNLAAVSGSDIGTTSDIVTDALTAFGMKASESDHLADIMTAAMTNSNTDTEKLGESYKYAAPLAGAYGFSAEDTTLLLGLAANAGIKGRTGGTTLRTVFTKLSDDISMTDADGNVITVKVADEKGNMRSLKSITDDLRAAFKGMSAESKNAINDNLTATAEELGISVTDETGKLKSTAVLYGEIADELDNMTEAGKVQEAQAIGGKTAMAGLLAIMNASEDEYDRLANAIYNCDGAAEKAAKTMLDNLSGDMTIAKSAAEGLGITLGDIVTPQLRTMAQNGTAVLQRMSEFAERNPWIVKTLAATTAGVLGANVAVSGLKLGVLALNNPILQVQSVLKKYKTAKEAAGNLKALSEEAGLLTKAMCVLGPTGMGVVTLIGAATAAGFAIYNVVKKNREEWLKFGETVAESRKRFEEARDASKQVTDMKSEYEELGKKIKSGALSAEQLADAQQRREDIEQWFIDNYSDFCTAEQQKRGEMEKSIGVVDNYVKSVERLQGAELKAKIAELEANAPGYKETIADLEAENDELNAERLENYSKVTELYNIVAAYDENRDAVAFIKAAEEAGIVIEQRGASTGTYRRRIESKIESLKKDAENKGKEIEDNKTEIQSAKDSLNELNVQRGYQIEDILGSTYEEATKKAEALRRAKYKLEKQGSIDKDTLAMLEEYIPGISEAEDKTGLLNEVMTDFNSTVKEATDYANTHKCTLEGVERAEEGVISTSEKMSVVADVLKKVRDGAELTEDELEKIESIIPGIGAQADKLTPLEKAFGTLEGEITEAVNDAIIFNNMWNDEAKEKSKYNEIKGNFDVVKGALDKVKRGAELTKDEVQKLEKILPGISSMETEDKIKSLETKFADLALQLLDAANKAQDLTNKINGIPTAKTIYTNFKEKVSGNTTSTEKGSFYNDFVAKGGIVPTQKNALGTDYSASVYIAGENGPELITNAKGSKVFTAIETARIFQKVNDLRNMYAPAKVQAPYVDERAMESGNKYDINIEFSPVINGGSAEDIGKILAEERDKLIAQVMRKIEEKDVNERRRRFA